MSLGESIRTFGSDRMCASTSFSSLRCSSDISLLLASAMDVALDLVRLVVRAVLGRVAVALDLVLGGLVVRAVLGRVAVALDLIVFPLLVRHLAPPSAL